MWKRKIRKKTAKLKLFFFFTLAAAALPWQKKKGTPSWQHTFSRSLDSYRCIAVLGKQKMKWRRAIPALLYTTIDIPIALDLNWGLKLKVQDHHQFLPPTMSVTAPTIALAFLQLCTTVYGLWLGKWCHTPRPYKTAALVSEVLNISATTQGFTVGHPKRAAVCPILGKGTP